MIDLPRHPPSPIPALYPVPEYLADAELSRRYTETKTALGVPWMGVVTMAFAHYRRFWETLWDGVRPIAESAAFVDGCAALREFTEEGVARLRPPSTAERLSALGYAPRELDNIRATIETFSDGNFPYLAIATLGRLLLEGGELTATTTSTRSAVRPVPAALPLTLMEAHHADLPTRALYEDVKARLGLPFVNTDYRALARWPSYFALAWGDLRPLVRGNVHEGLAAEVHTRAIALVLTLPNPQRLTSEALRAAASRDVVDGAVLNTVRLFQWLLPTLVVNVAFFRAGLR